MLKKSSFGQFLDTFSIVTVFGIKGLVQSSQNHWLPPTLNDMTSFIDDTILKTDTFDRRQMFGSVVLKVTTSLCLHSTK